MDIAEAPASFAVELAAPAPPPARKHGFQPGSPKIGGRQKGTPNKDRSITIARIVKLADPIGILCQIANGEPMLQAPTPGAEPVMAHPTMADRLAALKTLAAKVMPDLKQVSVDDGGSLVSVVLQLGQKVTVSQ